MKRCPVMIAFKQSTAQAVPVYCGQWSCSRCAQKLANKWAHIARYGVRKIGENKCYFWTLTMGRKIKTAKKAYTLLPKMFDALRKSMQRRYGTWLYLAFVEGQPKRGNMPHFHIISFQKSPERRLKDYVTKFGFGFQADESEIEGWQVARYVAKYATKQNPDTPRGFRRVRASREWPKPEKRKFDSLIVQSSKERLGDYFIRVARETGVGIDKVILNYYETLEKLTTENSKVT